MSPARAMSAYWTEPAYQDLPLRGPDKAEGIVIWNNGLNGHESTNEQLPPYLVEALVVRGWDAIKLDRNPVYENQWSDAGLKHAARLVEEAESARKKGYRRVILAGSSYGGAIALAAADSFPAYAVIALSPNTGQSVDYGMPPSDRNSRTIERTTYQQVAELKASRAVLVLAPDDELARNIDRAPYVREQLTAESIPFLLIDREVHGHGAGSSRAFIPYAECATWLLAPETNPRSGEFRCYRDEAREMLTQVGLDPTGTATAWFGYTDASGQEIAVVEHDAAGATTVDFGWGRGLVGHTPEGTKKGLPATRQGNALTFTVNSATVVMESDGAQAKLSFTPADKSKPIAVALTRLDVSH